MRSREGKRGRLRGGVALNGSEGLECRENRLHTELRADVLCAKVLLSCAGLHPTHFLALLSGSFLEWPAYGGLQLGSAWGAGGATPGWPSCLAEKGLG